ncbi:MFS transporter, partial [Streptomyces rubiginosohelvolus]
MTQTRTETASEPPPDKPEVAVPEAEAPVRSTRAFVTILITLLWPLEVVSLSYNLVVPAATDVAVHFGTRQVGWVFTILTLVGAVAGPIMTKLGDIHGKKKVMVFGAAAASVGGILAAAAPSFPVLLAGRALQGLLLPLVALSYSLMRDIFPARWVAFSASLTVG